MTTKVDEDRELIEAVEEASPDNADWLIRASGLRKKYCRDLRRSLWYSLCDVLEGLGLRRTDAEELREHEFWAIDGISFELRRGDSLGLLGRNGAGKSTLLKLITGQRSLTAGEVVTRGRIVALTELGLGFDPVLSGRENAYVNAAVYGVSRRDFDKIIEKIIDFSELREFIDSAVHTYSTGMKARLGYSVATHLDPDILVVDEVLAVGDLEFRRKCVQHIQAFLRQGGSVILVAHDPYLVQSICNRAIILDRGRAIFEGNAVEAVDLHFRMGHANQYEAVAASAELERAIPEGRGANESLEDATPGTASGEGLNAELPEGRLVMVDNFEVTASDGGSLETGKSVKVVLRYRSRIRAKVSWGFTVCTGDLQVTIASCTRGLDGEDVSIAPGENSLVCILPELILRPGVYAIRGGIGEAESLAALGLRGYDDSPCFFTVSASNASRTSNLQMIQNDLVIMKAEWP